MDIAPLEISEDGALMGNSCDTARLRKNIIAITPGIMELAVMLWKAASLNQILMRMSALPVPPAANQRGWKDTFICLRAPG